MKTNSTKQWMKVAGLSLVIGTLAFSANAQNTAPIQQTTITNAAAKTKVVGTGATDGGAVRLVDNKGTIKYLQVQNGITQITNTTTSGVTTTWQLGGTLTNNTYITTGDGTGTNPGIFALEGLQVQASTTPAATSTTLGDPHATPGTGWTVLVRDESTGAIKKMILTEFLQVVAGENIYTSDGTTTEYTPTDMPTTVTYSKVSVYRNGAKLLANADYTVASGKVTLVPSNTTGANGEWALYAGDVIEIHWIK